MVRLGNVVFFVDAGMLPHQTIAHGHTDFPTELAHLVVLEEVEYG